MNNGYKNYEAPEIAAVKVQDAFWSRYVDLIRAYSIPFLWDALNDGIAGAEPSHAVQNYQIAGGSAAGDFYGPVFQDSDVTKWLESASLYLMRERDAGLEALLDQVIDIVVSAQQPDGYLDTYFTIAQPEMRWKNLQEGHELYCAGHLIEAAVAYNHATGKRKLLDAACRFADLIADVFGTDAGQIPGYAGHPEIEVALVKLYETTGHERYLRTAKYFVDQRGREPYFFDEEARARDNRYIYTRMSSYGRGYAQAHCPVRAQSEATGHAVRATYLYAGMADVAMYTRDAELMAALKRLWRSVVDRKMYVTGAIGASAYGEAFSVDYDLPNDRAYAETCASVGLMMFASRMLKYELDGEYGDVLETALYNVVLGGIALDGKAFFYVNPLEVDPALCAREDTKHVLPQRQKWFACSCCPPNAIRTILSVGGYAYSMSEDALNIHLFVGGDLQTRMRGVPVAVRAESTYLIDGKVRYRFSMPSEADFALHIRAPKWSKRTVVRVNGDIADVFEAGKGYLGLRRTFRDGDVVEVAADMSVRFCYANPRVRADQGKVAVRRGPLIYCAEEIDNGPDLHLISVDPSGEVQTQYEPDLLHGVTTITLRGERRTAGEALYTLDAPCAKRPVSVKLIPYYTWANRGENEMAVWLERCR